MIKIKIWGIIGLQTSDTVENALSSVVNDDEPILILINSVGGSLSDAVAICNILEGVKNPIITVAMGNCISAAVMIFLCGKSRYVGKNITFMIHQPYIISSDDIQNLKRNEDLSVGLKRSLNIYKKYIVKNTDIPKDKLDKAFLNGEDLYLNSNECMKYKIATNLFTNWNTLYESEKINIKDEEVVLFSVLTQEAGES